MRCFVGTSGWSYDWNPDGFKWYATSSGLNAVELNASFYRLPFPSMVVAWSKHGTKLRWSIKVHRLVTHVYRMRPPKSIDFLRKFLSVFKPLEDAGVVDFYLFQLPPGFRASEDSWRRIEEINCTFDLGPRMAIEWRHASWMNSEWVRKAADIGVTVVSVDSPDFIFYARSSRKVYVRMHSRSSWYAHDYNREELLEVVRAVERLGGDDVFVFFNNNHAMLANARMMISLLKDVLGCGSC